MIYIDLLRMVPLIMVIFRLFFLIPILTGSPVGATTAALAALLAFNASYMAEVNPAGIQSVPCHLVEAARCRGQRYRQCIWHIVLPIAMRNILPAPVSQMVALDMGASLVYVIGVREFFRAATKRQQQHIPTLRSLHLRRAGLCHTILFTIDF